MDGEIIHKKDILQHIIISIQREQHLMGPTVLLLSQEMMEILTPLILVVL